jgi:hypothetical protein
MTRSLGVAALAIAAGSLPAASRPAEARITSIEIAWVEPFAEGTSFGQAGAYERVVGTARGELDPGDPRNRGIVNLDKAPRNAAGKVEYSTDLFILRPVDGAKGNHEILYEVNNRGRKFMLPWLMDAPAKPNGGLNDPKTAEDAGNGLVLRQGFTLVWSGWDPDAPRDGAGLAMSAPIATDQDRPIVSKIREELVSGTRGPLAATFRLSYPAAIADPKQATLTVRRKQAYPPAAIPAEGWEFADAQQIRLLPAGTKPAPGSLYELTYQATAPKVLGIGFAATRDVIASLRRDQPEIASPGGGPITAVLAVGISQSGRYLRDHIGQGFNQDEAGRKVFDGVLTHISGAGRVFVNAAFGEPGRTNTQHEDHEYPENAFPFSTATTVDPLTGTAGSLLRGDGFDPLLIEVNTSTEYWQKGASLLTTDPAGHADLALPPTARVFMIAGTQHGGRAGLGTDRGACVNPRNPHSPAPALRALILDLNEWVTKGMAPPDSLVPRLADGTLVRPDETGFPALPNFVTVREANAVTPPGDWVTPKRGPAKNYPAESYPAESYAVRVAAVDADGNEVAGLRLPDHAVPLATFTGWNQYAEPFPSGELCDRDGSWSPFARTKAERDAAGDPRLSLEERYGTKTAFVAKRRAAADELVRRRLLLAEDALRYVAEAERAEF